MNNPIMFVGQCDGCIHDGSCIMKNNIIALRDDIMDKLSALDFNILKMASENTSTSIIVNNVCEDFRPTKNNQPEVNMKYIMLHN